MITDGTEVGDLVLCDWLEEQGHSVGELREEITSTSKSLWQVQSCVRISTVLAFGKLLKIILVVLIMEQLVVIQVAKSLV